MSKPIALGDVVIRQIVELARMPVAPNWLLTNASAEVIEAEYHWLGERTVERASGRLIVSMHSFLVQARGLNILVDTCFGSERERGSKSPYHMVRTDYLAALHAAGITEADVDYVFCTHLHVDHVGWNTHLLDGRWVPTFPNARYLFSRADFDGRIAAEREGKVSEANMIAFRECVLPIVDAGKAIFLEPGTRFVEELVPELRVVELPGHCPGHSGLEICSHGRYGMITGDAIHHPIQLVRPDWVCTADTDPPAGVATRLKLLEDFTDADRILLTAHFPAPTPGRIVTRGGAVRFDPLD
jgi:glyoxylase-like metal-dependent hydrolase (beta-lactamase superfamily II)